MDSECQYKNKRAGNGKKGINHKRKSLKQKYMCLSREYKVLQETYIMLKDNLTITLDEIDQRDLILNEYEAELYLLKNKLSIRDKEFKNSLSLDKTDDYKKKIAELESCVQSYGKSLADVYNEQYNDKKIIDDLEEQISVLTSSQKKLYNENVNLNLLVDEHVLQSQETNYKNNKIEELEDSFKNYEKLLNDAYEKINENTNTISLLQETNDVLSSSQNKLYDENYNLNLLIDDQDNAINDLDSKYLILKEKYKRGKDIIKILESDNENLIREIEKFNNIESNYLHDIKTLEQNTDILQNNEIELKSKINILEDECEYLENIQDELRDSLSEVKKKRDELFDELRYYDSLEYKSEFVDDILEDELAVNELIKLKDNYKLTDGNNGLTMSESIDNIGDDENNYGDEDDDENNYCDDDENNDGDEDEDENAEEDENNDEDEDENAEEDENNDDDEDDENNKIDEDENAEEDENNDEDEDDQNNKIDENNNEVNGEDIIIVERELMCDKKNNSWFNFFS